MATVGNIQVTNQSSTAKGYLYVNIIGLNELDRSFCKLIYYIRAQMSVSTDPKRVIQTDLNKIFADSQIVWNLRDHFKLQLNPQAA